MKLLATQALIPLIQTYATNSQASRKPVSSRSKAPPGAPFYRPLEVDSTVVLPAALTDFSKEFPVAETLQVKSETAKRKETAWKPVAPVKRKKNAEKLPASSSDDPYAAVKLGEQRRALIKSAISEKIQNDEGLRVRCIAMAKIKAATVSELMRMCEICGILPWAMNLANSRKTDNYLPKLVD